MGEAATPMVTAVSNASWTLEAFMIHTTALRNADERFYTERDRRYTEVAQEREKALKIKETADETARVLAREIQDYKDEKANELRTQIERERGTYATHTDLTAAVSQITTAMAPLVEYVASQRGKSTGLDKAWAYLFAVAGVAVAVAALVTR